MENKQEQISQVKKLQGEYFDLLEKQINKPFFSIFKSIHWIFFDILIGFILSFLLIVGGSFIHPMLGYALGFIGFLWYQGENIPLLRESGNKYNLTNLHDGTLIIYKKEREMKRALYKLKMLSTEQSGIF